MMIGSQENRFNSTASPNALPAGQMSSEERLEEISEILALGLLRLLGSKSSEEVARSTENSLDFAWERSVDQPVSREDHRP